MEHAATLTDLEIYRRWILSLTTVCGDTLERAMEIVRSILNKMWIIFLAIVCSDTLETEVQIIRHILSKMYTVV